MNTLLQDKTASASRSFMTVTCLALTLASAACAATPPRKASEPLNNGEARWPDYVVKDTDRVDRLCGAREAKLQADLQEGKQDQDKFKTIIGSITGGVTTAGGVAGGVGAYVISDQSTKQTMTGVTGFVSAGLGAAGTVVTILVAPGKAKMEGANHGLTTLDAKRNAAREVLKKDPGAWTSADKEAWNKAKADLEAACARQ
jgi:hypothetical protein